uniref:Si:ch73-22o12.1 n=1 Tax=Tetraodon nigroviridis TaxID=99883 RepID=H3CRE6_TETNG
ICCLSVFPPFCLNRKEMTHIHVFLSFLFTAALGQRVKVEPEVSSYPGQTVNLRCAFTDATGIQLTMVTWIYEPKEGDRLNIAVFHPNFEPNYPDSPVKGRVSFMPSPPVLESPSIQISDVRMNDEGRYICEYATYPSGNEQGITQLVMLAKPQNSASIVTVEAGTSPVVVARCDSVDGRPASEVKWVTTANGNATSLSKINADNTVTINSEYRMVPKPEDNGKDISCVVTHRTLNKPDSFSLKLVVQYAPQVTIVGYDNNWYLGRTNVVLTCQATANPIPFSVDWKTMTGDLPDTVQRSGNELKVLKVDDSVNTTFVCEVKNRIGTGKDQVTAFVRAEPPVNPSNAGVVAGAVIGSLLALLLVAALIAVLVTRSRGKKASKNGTSGGTGDIGGGNNNGPIYVNELDDAERRKFDELEEEERYDRFSGGGPILQLRPAHDQSNVSNYLDDDMESQKDGSVISRTAVYV